MKRSITGLWLLSIACIILYITWSNPFSFVFLFIGVISLITIQRIAMPESKQQEYLYKGWLKIIPIKHKDRIYEKLVMYDGVLGLVINTDNKILLVRQFRPAVGKYTWEIPAGCLDKDGEVKADALIRELGEEAEIPADKVTGIMLIKQYLAMAGCSSATSYIYMITVDVPSIDKIITGDDEVEEIMWVTYEELERMVKSNIIEHNATQRSYEYLREQLLLRGKTK